jgi:hypothetical protein
MQVEVSRSIFKYYIPFLPADSKFSSTQLYKHGNIYNKDRTDCCHTQETFCQTQERVLIQLNDIT